jgi:hypothetical protein
MDEVQANRDFVFPPLQAEDDDGSLDTEFSVTVPFKVSPQRWGALSTSLRQWADDQGLLDFIDQDQIGVVAVYLPKDMPPRGVV